MTYEQAEIIMSLEYIPEAQLMNALQQQSLSNEMAAQCSRGRGTKHEDFMYYAGLLEGMKRAGLIRLLEEAKEVIRLAREKEKK